MSRPIQLPHDWFPAPLPPNVSLGEGTWLYSAYAFLHCQSRRPLALRTGTHCGLYNGTLFELGPDGAVEIGDYTTLVGVTFATNAPVQIGSWCFLAHEVTIADRPAPQPPPAACLAPAAGSGAAAPVVTLGDDVWVGTGAVLLPGAHLGDGVVVGAGAVVDFQVPPHAIVAGNPARIVGSAAD